jgi:hypothetical protein
MINRTPARAISTEVLIARQLGLDPVEFRRKNLLKDGLPPSFPNGTRAPIPVIGLPWSIGQDRP